MSAMSIKRDSKLFIGELSNAIQAVRAPLFVAALAAVSVTLIDQLQEILFLFAEETFAQSGRQILFASSLFILFCLLLWRIANDLLTVSNYRRTYASRRAQILRRMLPYSAFMPDSQARTAHGQPPLCKPYKLRRRLRLQ